MEYQHTLYHSIKTFHFVLYNLNCEICKLNVHIGHIEHIEQIEHNKFWISSTGLAIGLYKNIVKHFH